MLTDHYLVPMVGVEPTRSCLQQILSLSRLPFHHIGLLDNNITTINKNQLFIVKFLAKFFTFLYFFLWLLLLAVANKKVYFFLGFVVLCQELVYIFPNDRIVIFEKGIVLFIETVICPFDYDKIGILVYFYRLFGVFYIDHTVF